jgi:hypothetical protein
MPEGRVILSKNDEVKSFALDELLPYGFRL